MSLRRAVRTKAPIGLLFHEVLIFILIQFFAYFLFRYTKKFLGSIGAQALGSFHFDPPLVGLPVDEI